MNLLVALTQIPDFQTGDWVDASNALLFKLKSIFNIHITLILSYAFVFLKYHQNLFDLCETPLPLSLPIFNRHFAITQAKNII